MSCGIYMIKNSKTKQVYVGSSINLSDREYKHFWMLNRNQHYNRYLQNSYNVYGSECFTFTILDECDETDLIKKENDYILKFKSNNQKYGYNLATVNEFRRNNYNESVKRNLSKTNLNKNGNFDKFEMINIKTGKIHIFDNLVDCANFLIENGFSKGKPRNLRVRISECIRGIKIKNGYKNGVIRKTINGHRFNIINN
jgi:hypothetical protein